MLCPHVTFVVRQPDSKPSGLLAAVGHTRDLEPHEVGSLAHTQAVAAKVASMISELGVTSGNVQLVLIKCPLLTSAKTVGRTK